MSKRLCERCGQKIPAERIEALPDTLVCVQCAREMGGSEFELFVAQERTSKSSSFKHNYGCVSEIAKVRKPIVPKRRK